MQSAKCWAPPSRRSSRSTEVITTYLRRMSAMAMARFFGSSTSRAFGRPWPTSQNGQRRVQMSPMIMKVAVPPEKHSPRFGQEASSQTLCSLCLRSSCLTRSTSGETGIRTRIQSGFFGRSTVGMIFTGMRATFSAPRSFTPASTFGRAARSVTLSVGIRVCTVSSTVSCAVVISVDSARYGRLLSIVEVFDELRAQPGTYLGKFNRSCMVAQLGHCQPRIPAGINPSKRFQVHVHIQGQAMERTSVADTKPQRGDFRSVDIHARGVRPGHGGHTVAGQQFDQAMLDPCHQFANAETKAPYIQHQVGNQLAGAMIGHLAATIDLHYRNIARQQQMFGLARLALGENRCVLHQPGLVFGIATAPIGKALHRMPGRLVGDLTQIAKAQAPAHQSTMCTKPVARRALLISRNWSSPVARMCS